MYDDSLTRHPFYSIEDDEADPREEPGRDGTPPVGSAGSSMSSRRGPGTGSSSEEAE